MDRYQQGVKVSSIAIGANILLGIVKISIGLLVGSTGLIADGFHSISDIVSTVGVLIAVKIAKQPPDSNHHYGHGQAEPIAAKILGLILIITGVALAVNSINQIIKGSYDVIGLVGLTAVIFSIIVKEGLYHYTVKVGKSTNNQALMADAWHHRSDVISSFAAGAGILGAYFGYPILDPVAGVVVSLMIIRVGWKVLEDAITTLMGAAPEKSKLQKIEEDVIIVDGVEEVMELKGHYYGADLYLDLKILVDYRYTVLEGHQIASQVKKNIIEKYSEVVEVMVHVDPMLPSSGVD